MTQKEALKILESGHNVLLTGPAGSGKTYLLEKFIRLLKKQGIGVAVTASTGIAATHIGGRTIHSWAGIGIKDSLTHKQLQSIAKKPYMKKQLEGMEVLVIDEISMLHSYHLDMVDMVCREIKRNELPFGGLQVVMSGDFFQLPPVSSEAGEADFVYKSRVWQEMDVQICYLEEQHRHSGGEIARLLEEMRGQKLSAQSRTSLLSRLAARPEKVRPVRLYTHNEDVDRINAIELSKIDGEEHVYNMTGFGDKTLVESLKKNCLAPEKLILKLGARVMFVKNKYEEDKTVYVNGSTGEVVGFSDEHLPAVRLDGGETVIVSPDAWTVDDEESILARIDQIPLRLAWAITVHKSQGMTLDSAEIDLSRCFGYGMGYVALSRLRNLSGLYLLGINEFAYRLDPQVHEFDQVLLALSHKASEGIKIKKRFKQASFLR
ncbi:MAG: PIF1 family DEAD/DEAH box helicase [Bacillota bacterium]